jgi:carboxypeptidase C (cathepsin A)
MSTTYYLVNKEQYNQRKRELGKIERFVEYCESELENRDIQYDDSVLHILKNGLEDELFYLEEIEILRTSWGGEKVSRKVKWIKSQEYIDDMMRSGEYLLIDEYDEQYTLDEFYEKMK